MGDYFSGWYFKCQSDTQTLAVIIALHRSSQKDTCSIQIITDDHAWMIPYSKNALNFSKGSVLIGKNQFCENGLKLSVHTSDLSANGILRFGPLTPLKYDIMGPFFFVPFLECRHRVWSMRHRINGSIFINGKEYLFQNAKGYWEGDRGRSFPKEYLWTQCFFKDGSLMLSVADIPLGKLHFNGIIGVVLWKGRQYRIATYLGAKIHRLQNRTVQIVQNNLRLEARLIKEASSPLKAPSNGNMTRTIHESAACRASYRFSIKGRTVFAFETDQASFEFEYS